MNSGQHAPFKKRQVDANAGARKCIDKPKRPLSAFNLFYRFKRQKVLTAIAQGETKKENITRLVQAPPGLEEHPLDAAQDSAAAAAPRDLSKLRRDNIVGDLRHNLLPRDTSDRSHRKNQSAMNGTMSFLELARLMNVAWKECDDLAKCVFRELSDESRRLYRERLREYKSSKEAVRTPEKLEAPPPKPKQKLKVSSPCPVIEQSPPPTTNDEANKNDLMLRVKELEGQLEAERLRGRVRELEGQLGRQRTVEDHLRAQITAPTGDGQQPGRVCLPGGRRTVVEDQLRMRAQMVASMGARRTQELERFHGGQRGTVEDRSCWSRAQHTVSSGERQAREMEILLERQRTVQDAMRARLASSIAARARELDFFVQRRRVTVEDRSGSGPRPSGGVVPTARSSPGGLSALVNASMIHPSLQASSGHAAGAPSRIATTRLSLPAKQGLERGDLRRQVACCAEDAGPNKKQRRE